MSNDNYATDEEVKSRGLSTQWPGEPILSTTLKEVITRLGKALAEQFRPARIHNVYTVEGKIHVLINVPGCPEVYADIFPESKPNPEMNLKKLQDSYFQWVKIIQAQDSDTPDPLSFQDVCVISDDTDEMKIYAILVPYIHMGAQAQLEKFID